MKITAEEIAIHLKDKRLARIEGKGSPISFEQLNNADDRQELNSNRIVFNSREQTVKAEGGESGRVSIRIQPPQADQ